MLKKIFTPIIAIVALIGIVLSYKQIQQLISQAAPQPANIIIDTQNTIGPITYPWSAFAQGGEESPPMLSQVTKLLKQVSPRYVRLDHIYDTYSVVQKTPNGYLYDFSRLDKTVDDIIISGALPFFNLSYMPPVFTSSGSVIDQPNNWNDWEDLVKRTVEHYSGKSNRNLLNIYYEVWNEPELPQFGNFQLSGEKDYRLLYFYAVSGVNKAFNVNNFFIGGPGVGSFYPVWVKDFLSYVSQNDLRLDFYSWHRYTRKPEEYLRDATSLRNQLNNFPKYSNIPLIITEWGLGSDNSEINSSTTAAAFSLASIAKFYNKIDLAFSFEIKDGPPPNGGKWGFITHEKDAKPLSIKPRFKTFSSLSKLKGNMLKVSGEGTYISALSAINSSQITAIVGNYDFKGQNTENVPITFTGLSPASYLLKYKYPLGETQGEYEVATTNGVITKSFLMPPNTLLFLELTPVADLATFIPGPSNINSDLALILKNNTSPLFFTSPEFHLLPEGRMELDINYLWNEDDTSSFNIFEAPYTPDDSLQNILFLRKERDSSSNFFSFGISSKGNTYKASFPIVSPNKWHHLILEWTQTYIALTIDGILTKLEIPLDIRNGKTLIFYPVNAAIDNLKIFIGKEQILERKFDGRTDR